jgi:cytoskeletal protein RodZ
MKLDTSTWMMIFFIILLVVSIWKIYAFLPNKVLKDDDTTEASHEELEKVMLETLLKTGSHLTHKELYLEMTKDTNFNKKHFWRFNENKLNQLLTHYYMTHEGINSIKDIYNSISSK